ncbi:unnamed protein product [Leptidea sinapis]|uniref:Uncharacterized protein n=1 Tax=Leptidea sinapis TaxID=189913 RepID=A0A5E4Q0S3_9NEOP|nr:unnamed protein product [Leptidea sinapis]
MNFNSSLRMGLTSNTGLLSSLPQRSVCVKEKSNNIELRCEVTPAPYILRPYAGLYNPFSHGCSVLCNHPADANAKEYVKRVKDAWAHDGRTHCFHEDLSKFQDQSDKDKNRTPHDIVTEDMFRRYTETDSRPHTPAPTLASGKSRGSRRCLTPDQPHPKTTIETLYYHGYTTSEAIPCNTSTTIDRSTLPSLNLSEVTHTRLVKGECEQLPPLASPLILPPFSTSCECSLKHVTHIVVNYAPKSRKRGGEIRRRGKRRRKGRGGGSDRLTSAGLAAQAQQDPETQVAGIGTDSHNSSSRPSLAAPSDDVIVLPLVKTAFSKKTDSFLDDDILKFLHRERRYVLEEALRTRPDRALSQEMHALLRELRSPAVCLGDWLHDIQEGLILMMGGIMTHEQATQYESIMEWQHYLDEDFSDEIKLHMLDTYRKQNAEGDTGESVINTIKYRTWCGLCAICERMYGRFPPRDKDPPEGIELSDFTMIETKLSALNVHRGLLEILNTIRSR